MGWGAGVGQSGVWLSRGGQAVREGQVRVEARSPIPAEVDSDTLGNAGRERAWAGASGFSAENLEIQCHFAFASEKPCLAFQRGSLTPVFSRDSSPQKGFWFNVSHAAGASCQCACTFSLLVLLWCPIELGNHGGGWV